MKNGILGKRNIFIDLNKSNFLLNLVFQIMNYFIYILNQLLLFLDNLMVILKMKQNFPVNRKKKENKGFI